MAALSELIDQVETELRDTSNDNWSTAELTQHLRRALRAYNQVDPRRLAGTLTASAGSREVSLSSLSGLMELVDVWYPWDASDPAYPPERPQWQLIADGTLYLQVADVPAGGETVRLFYTAPHTLSGLDSATTTTLDDAAEGLLVLGASAYAAMQWAQAIINTVTVSGWSPRQASDWAQQRYQAFKGGLEAVRRRAVSGQDARV